MSRRVPRCAWCGEPLTIRRSGGTIRSTLPDLPGRPEVGWHIGVDGPGCALTDPLFKELVRRSAKGVVVVRTPIAILCEIDGRGEGRLIANKAAASWRSVATRRATL